MHEEISNSIKIRNCWNWYELGGKSNKYFWNLEIIEIVKIFCVRFASRLWSPSSKTPITDLTKINSVIFNVYTNLFKEKLEINSESLNNFLNDISIPSLSETEKQICEEELTEKDIYETMISFANIKSPGNDRFTKEFCNTFWQDVRDIFINSLQESKLLKYLCISQGQAIIKLLEKRNKDKRYDLNS